MTEVNRVLAGYDASPQSHHAVNWAAAYAVSRGWPLVIGMAVDLSLAPVSAGPGMPPIVMDIPDPGTEQAFVEKLATSLRDDYRGLTVTVEAVRRTAAGYLVEQSAKPGIVVIGTRHLGPIRSALLGGVADQVVTHAHGPVAVVPVDAEPTLAEVPDPSRPIIVGVDEHRDTNAAVTFALEEARRSGLPVEIVSCWFPAYPIPALAEFSVLPDDIDASERTMAAMNAAVVADAQRAAPDVPITGRMLHGVAFDLLVELSRGASLMVVGSRGRGGFAGLLLGSTSRKVLQGTHCPAVVVPH